MKRRHDPCDAGVGTCSSLLGDVVAVFDSHINQGMEAQPKWSHTRWPWGDRLRNEDGSTGVARHCGAVVQVFACSGFIRAVGTSTHGFNGCGFNNRVVARRQKFHGSK